VQSLAEALMFSMRAMQVLEFAVDDCAHHNERSIARMDGRTDDGVRWNGAAAFRATTHDSRPLSWGEPIS
jgi:hypothetical protein